ncbi:MAG: ParB N-terminal domain-containing protein [Rhodospirillales bacterium]|nr:ParB N-terminal domain-containing protein [Rhodospirillales bacterium]
MTTEPSTTERSTTSTSSGGTVLVLDPSDVQVNPINARKKLRDIPALTASVREVGVLEPVLVRMVEADVYMLVAGERRRAAAIAAGVKLPAIVLPDAAVPAWEALAMLSENESRDSLTTSERARAFQTVLDLGADPTSVAAAASTTVEEVAHLSAVAQSKVAATVTERYDLTLEQAVVLAEFAEDKEAVKALTVIARENPGRWEYAVTTLRRERDRRLAMEAKLRPYVEAKVRVLTELDIKQTIASYEGGNHSRRPIAMLVTDKGKNLTPAGHKKCPGRSVGVWAFERWTEPDVTEFCEDPAKHGHKPKAKATRTGTAASGNAGAEKTEAEKQADSEARRKVIANNKAMDVANEVRRKWLTTALKAKQPKGLERFVTEHVVLAYQVGTTGPVLAEITGATLVGAGAAEKWLKSLPENRVLMGLFAYVAAGIETNVDKTAWRHADARLVAYLRFLESAGYTLSDIEAEACAEHEKRNRASSGSAK